MCGRFTLSADPQAVAALCNLPNIPELKARYNVSPGQTVAVVRAGEPRRLDQLKWGLIPFWAKDAKIAYSLINARGETISSKPAFRAAFKKRRCLIPADGFYEWKKEGKKKLPMHFHRIDHGVFAFAGLWESWTDPEGQSVETCTIVTTEANDLVKPFHDRMPVMLDRPEMDRWLDETASAESLTAMLHSYPVEQMSAVDANPVVNSSRHEGANCLQPIV